MLARLTALDHKNAGGGNLAHYTWTFDSDRRITNFTNTDGTSDYTYDSNDQVTVVDHSYQTDESYAYDANGNRTNTGYTTGTNNRVTSDGTYNYTYDDEGNRISQTKISDSTKVEYTWDYRNRLTDVVFKTSGGTVTKKVQYQYDVFDRRIGKKIDANGDSTYDSGTYWVYDDAGKRDPNTGTALDDIVLEFTDADGDGSGLATLTTRYLHGPGIDQILASETQSGNVVTWALADHQGTVRDMVRYASGTTTVVNHRKYEAFGNLTSESDPTVKFLYSYTGREWDGDANLYYYRARWYDAASGRFISEDPLGFGGTDANLSRYIGNSAPNFTDPTGCRWVLNTNSMEHEWEPESELEWLLQFEEPNDWESENNLRRLPHYLLNVLDDVETFRWMEEFRQATEGLPIIKTGLLYRRQLQTLYGFHGQLAVELPSANGINTEWRVLTFASHVGDLGGHDVVDPRTNPYVNGTAIAELMATEEANRALVETYELLSEDPAQWTGMYNCWTPAVMLFGWGIPGMDVYNVGDEL